MVSESPVTDEGFIQDHKSVGSVPEQSSHKVGAAVDFVPNPLPEMVIVSPWDTVPDTPDMAGAAINPNGSNNKMPIMCIVLVNIYPQSGEYIVSI